MITVERLKDLRPANPFVPFVLHLTDGRRSPVTGPAPFEVSPELVQAAEDPIERLGPDHVAEEVVGLKATPAAERLRPREACKAGFRSPR